MAQSLGYYVGKKYGRWTILEILPQYKDTAIPPRLRFICRRDCGRTGLIIGSNLLNKRTKSCEQRGCNYNTTHGLSSDRVWQRLKAAKRRCESPTCKYYNNYGEKGIKFFPEFSGDVIMAREWIIRNLGHPPSGMSLDRIDVNGNYTSGNLRWADPITQAANRRIALADDYTLIAECKRRNIL